MNEARCAICGDSIVMVDEARLPRGAWWGTYDRESGRVWTPSAWELMGLSDAIRAQLRALHSRCISRVREAKRSRQ